MSDDGNMQPRCPICEGVEFFYSEQWKNMRCKACGSAPRQRLFHNLLNERVPDWRVKRVHEFAPMRDWVSSKAPDYSSSQWFPDKPLGPLRGTLRNEDIEALTFPDNSVDVFLLEDVLEHLFHPELAIREMLRVLRPGGAALCSCPLEGGSKATTQCARLEDDGTVSYLKPVRYHGAPAGSGKSLVVWEYGFDFVDLCRKWTQGAKLEFRFGGLPEFLVSDSSRATFVVWKSPLA